MCTHALGRVALRALASERLPSSHVNVTARQSGSEQFLDWDSGIWDGGGGVNVPIRVTRLKCQGIVKLYPGSGSPVERVDSIRQNLAALGFS